MNNEKLAKKIYKTACECLINDLKKFPLDQEMINMFISDFSSTLKIALLVEDGHIKKALNYARGMDTAARDKIHDDFWKLQDKE